MFPRHTREHMSRGSFYLHGSPKDNLVSEKMLSCKKWQNMERFRALANRLALPSISMTVQSQNGDVALGSLVSCRRGGSDNDPFSTRTLVACWSPA